MSTVAHSTGIVATGDACWNRSARRAWWLAAAVVGFACVPAAWLFGGFFWSTAPDREQQLHVVSCGDWIAYERRVDFYLPPKTLRGIHLTRDLAGDPTGTPLCRLRYETVVHGIEWLDPHTLRVSLDAEPEYPVTQANGIAIQWIVERAR
jgi:hypothetical protein